VVLVISRVILPIVLYTLVTTHQLHYSLRISCLLLRQGEFHPVIADLESGLRRLEHP
jgi:hypothetical protein